ncbi:STAS domain-containing protein [Nitrospira defluvii]|nr:STAS domain-containing protein [Nitrospira defluvii]
MVLDINVRNDETTSRWILKGRFDYHANNIFRKTYKKNLEGKDKLEIEVDLGGVDYIDSSALGMLLLLKDKAENNKRSVCLVNCNEMVRQILDIANFEKMFKIK